MSAFVFISSMTSFTSRVLILMSHSGKEFISSTKSDNLFLKASTARILPKWTKPARLTSVPDGYYYKNADLERRDRKRCKAKNAITDRKNNEE